MLTRADQTVPDCLEVLDHIAPLGLRQHVGFKDVGVLAGDARRARDADPRDRRDELHGGRQHVARGGVALEARGARHRHRIACSAARRSPSASDPRAAARLPYHPVSGKLFDHLTKLGARPPRSKPTASGFARSAARASICRVSRDRGGSDRARARGAARPVRARRRLLARRGQRVARPSRSARCATPALMRVHDQAWPRSTARSRRSRACCARSQQTWSGCLQEATRL